MLLKPVPVPIAKKLILPRFIDLRKNTETEDKIQKEMSNGKNVEMARILGSQEEKIRHVLEQRFEKDDENFPTFYDMMDALMEAADFSESNINLEQTRKVLMKEKICKICQKRERCVSKIPCCHLDSCVGCSKFQSKCSICQGEIKKKITTYRVQNFAPELSSKSYLMS